MTRSFCVLPLHTSHQFGKDVGGGGDLKDWVKLIAMAGIGGLVATVFYPLLHETGHGLVAVICGGDVKEITLLTTPNILVECSSTNRTVISIVALSGTAFPFLMTLIIHPKQFLAWYGVFVCRLIVLLSLAVSVAVVVLHRIGVTIPIDDMTYIINHQKGAAVWLLLVLLCMAGVMIAQIKKEKPLEKIFQYFSL